MESGWPMGIIPITEQELKEFQGKAEMLAIYERQYKNMVEHALGLEDTLKAVKKLVETGPSPRANTLKDWQQAVDDWLGKMMNVLEADAE